MSNKKNSFFGTSEESLSGIYIILAVISIVVHVIICTYSNISAISSGIAILSAYAVLCGIFFLVMRRRLRIYRFENNESDKQNNGVIYAFKNYLKIPYAVINENGKIITTNLSFKRAAGIKDTFFNSDITSLCNISLQDIFNASEDADAQAETQSEAEMSTIVVSMKKRRYSVDCHPISAKGKAFYMLVFNDITELCDVKEKYNNEIPAVAYIILDNLDEIAQYVKESYQAEATQVEKILKEWALSAGAMIREYDRNKYILFMSNESLGKCVRGKFEILDSIREVRIGDDNMPITVSIGIATTGDTLAAREKDALAALDMALQRGGDQAVLKNETGISFFGGRTKSQQKRSKGHSRVIAACLCSMISGASNVIVMGHSNPDFDSIGACVGIAALSMHLGVDVKIVTNTGTDNFKACTGKLCELPEYSNVFVDGVVGLGEISFGTLLVIVDANNFKILEAPEIAANAFKTAVIDHHIKKEEFEHDPQLSYIDTTASSASELVSEILEQSLPTDTLRKEEANVLMAGIMVDTKNFTRTVGTRTFAAALYLRAAGASTEYARTFFEEAFEDYKSEARFGNNSELYREHIAITSSVGEDPSSDRIAAAKAADHLLTIRNVNAAFALVKIGQLIHISGRSNGSINVQLILEKIGGGGHFDMAGAALSDKELDEASVILKAAIDEYFDDITSATKQKD